MEYKTDDLALSAYLITVGFPIIGLGKNEKGFKVFIHNSPELANSTLQQYLIAYRTDVAMVNPQVYANNIRYIKRIINDEAVPNIPK